MEEAFITPTLESGILSTPGLKWVINKFPHVSPNNFPTQKEPLHLSLIKSY